MKNNSINVVLEVPSGLIKLRNCNIISSGYVLKSAYDVKAELGGADVYKSSYSGNKYVRQINLKRRG